MGVQVRLKDQNGDDAIIQVGESLTILATFTDLAETPTQLTSDDILTLTLTLFAGTTSINSRSGQNVKNANGGTLAADGTLTLALGPLDAVIVDTTLAAGALETHVARLTWTWNDGTARTGIQEHIFQVEKLATVA